MYTRIKYIYIILYATRRLPTPSYTYIIGTIITITKAYALGAAEYDIHIIICARDRGA